MRPKFTSHFAVIMTFIGVAVGLGNVWRFPYMASAFGGGAFLLVYLIILVLFGIPALLAELTLGRLTGRGPLGAFRQLGMPGARVFGWALFVTVLMATSYYTVIVGWVLKYFLASITGQIGATTPDAFFDNVLAGFWGQLLMTAIVLALVGSVLLLGIRQGIERLSTIATPLLFVLLLVLVVRTVSLPGAAEGLRFYLLPDFSKITPGVVMAALGQVFFSMSLGGTFMMTYASYLPPHVNLKRSAIAIGVGETFAAILAGFVIVPAAVVFGLELNSGPPLTFITVPTIFTQIPAGALFAGLFFGLLFAAAFLSAVAAVEVLVTTVVDELRWSRRRAILAFCGIELLLGTVSMVSLDYILKSDLIWGSIMQPVGSALAVIALVWVVNRGKALEEINRGNDRRAVGDFYVFWMRYVVPLGIGLILALGVADLFETLLAR